MIQLIIWGALIGPIILLHVFVWAKLKKAPDTAFFRCILTYNQINVGMLEVAKTAATFLAFGTTIIGAILQQGFSLQPDSPDFKAMLLLFTTITAVALLFYFTAVKRLMLYLVGDLLIYWASIGACLTLMLMLTKMTELPTPQLIVMELLLIASVILICWRQILDTAIFLCALCVPMKKEVKGGRMEE